MRPLLGCPLFNSPCLSLHGSCLAGGNPVNNLRDIPSRIQTGPKDARAGAHGGEAVSFATRAEQLLGHANTREAFAMIQPAPSSSASEATATW